MKWLPGEKTIENFKSAGTDIKNSSFQVTENGKYTVFVQDEDCDEVAVATIEVNNIVKDQNPAPGTDNQNPPPGTDQQNPAPGTDNKIPTTTPTTPALSTTTPPAASGYVLPETAAPMFDYVSAGLVMILAGLTALFLKRKKLN